MPPISMFRERDRPRAMEFGACKDCNRGTRGAGIVAAVFARMHPDHDIMSWQNLDIKHFVRDLDHDAPGVREELSQPGRQGALGSSARRRGCFRTSGRFALTAPWVNAYLTVFGAKLAMALYREHVGEALPMSGATWCQCRLNGSITQEYLDGLVEMMPGYETLRQGTKNVGDQFAYRFNTDERTVVAAVAQFHKGLWVTALASSDERIVALLMKPEMLRLPGSALIRAGELLSRLPQRSSPLRT